MEKCLRSFIFLFLLMFFTNAHAQNLLNISQVKSVDANGKSTATGTKCTLKGIIIGPTVGLNGRYNFSVYDSTGAIVINTNRFIFRGPVQGDSVSVTGKINQFTTGGNSGMTYLGDTFTVTKIGVDNYNIKDPVVVMKLEEKWESDFVKLDSLMIIDPKQWKTSFTGYSLVNAKKGSDTIGLRINNTVIATIPYAPKGLFNVQGIVYQSDNASPYLSGYQLGPRDGNDFELLYKPKIETYKIKEIRGINSASGVADSVGVVCAIKGVVQSRNLTTANKGNGLLLDFSDNTGSIVVYHDVSNFGNNINPGDSLRLVGTVMQTRGLIQFKPDTIDLMNGTGKLDVPKVITAYDDSLEARIVKLTNVRLKTPSQWDTTKFQNRTSFTVYVTPNGTDSFAVQVLRPSSLYYMAAPKGPFNITGFLSQNDNFPPYLQSYFIIPRDSFDYQALKVALPLLRIGQVKIDDGAGANLAAGKQLKCMLKGMVYSGNVSAKGLQFSIEDRTGAITVIEPGNTQAYNVQLGDSVLVRGMIAQKDGFTAILIDSLWKLGAGNKLLRPNIVSSLVEADESYTREVENLKLSDPAQWDTLASPNGFVVQAEDTFSNETFSIYISPATSAFRMPRPTGIFNLTAVVYQQDKTAPYDEGYFLYPWTAKNFDLLTSTGISSSSAADDLLMYPNPVLNNLQLRNLNGCKEWSIYNTLGVKVMEGKITNANELQLDISSLPAGVYQLYLNGGSKSFSRSLIKY